MTIGGSDGVQSPWAGGHYFYSIEYSIVALLGFKRLIASGLH